jgi:hypothetical protein
LRCEEQVKECHRFILVGCSIVSREQNKQKRG